MILAGRIKKQFGAVKVNYLCSCKKDAKRENAKAINILAKITLTFTENHFISSIKSENKITRRTNQP